MEIPSHIKFPFESDSYKIKPFSSEYEKNEIAYRWKKIKNDSLKEDKINFINWMCIGVPKGGTTSLFHYLNQHPQIYIPESKETQFFSSILYYNGISYYIEKFFNNVDITKSKAIGEISPKYLLHSQLVPRRIKRHIKSDIKFLVILRNPVERCWSHYCHSFERFKLFPFRPTEDLSFKEALSVERKRLEAKYEDTFFHHSWNAYYYTGLYDIHLSEWFKHFKRENFLIIDLMDLIENTNETLLEITQFLSTEMIELKTSFKKTNSYSKDNLPDDLKKELLIYYRIHIHNLEKLLNRDFSHWLKI